MPEREPAVGDAIHYIDPDQPGCRTAIVTAVVDPVSEAGAGIVDLAVLGGERAYEVPHVVAEHRVGDSWHWPAEH